MMNPFVTHPRSRLIQANKQEHKTTFNNNYESITEIILLITIYLSIDLDFHILSSFNLFHIFLFLISSLYLTI